MNRFEPTFGIRDTVKNVRNFVRENKKTFWEIFKPYMPYIVGASFLDAVFVTFLHLDIPFGQFVSAYFMAVLAISWHRVVIHGADNFVAVNPLKLTKNELIFMVMGILIPLCIGLIIFATIFFVSFVLAKVIGVFLTFLIVSCCIFLSMFLSLRLSFYFPAKATNAAISLMESYSMSEGMCLKLFFASFLAILPLYLALLGCVVIIVFISLALAKLSLSVGIVQLVNFVLSVPILLYFEPILVIIGITVLSNYYQFALQNKKELYS